MKSLIVLSTIALVAFVAADEEWKPNGFGSQNHEIHEKCFAETGVAMEEVEKIYKRQHTDEKTTHEYVLCNVKKMGVFTEESGYNVDRVIAELTTSHLDEEKARELVTKCVDNNEQKSTPAAWAYRFVDCMTANKVDDLLNEAEKAKNMKNRSSNSDGSVGR